MIVVTRTGQLGNQIFQIASALAVRAVEEKVYIADIPEFARCFELPPNVREFMLCGYTLRRRLLRGVLLELAGRLRLVSVIEEAQHPDGRIASTRTSRGLLPVTWINGGFFQDFRSAAAAGPGFPEFRPSVVKAARSWIARHCGPDEQRIFCHMRRADYLNFEGTGINVALPLSYYQAGLERILPEKEPFRLFLASDDIEFAELAFGARPQSVIIREEPCLTLAILSLCTAGVISNSSFSWWAGRFVVKHGGRVIAPRNWLGWAEGECEPRSIEDPAFEWIDVPISPRAANDRRAHTEVERT